MRAALLAVALLLVAAAPAAAAPQLVKVGDFADPLYVTSPPRDTRVFVVEKAGTIRIVGGGTFLDLRGATDSDDLERGLLSMAFAPDYATSGRFYVFYTAAPNGDIRIVEYRRSADQNRADPATGRPIFTTQHSATNHNGGQLQFGPDGLLYASIGDNADGDNAQDLTNNPFGKILRLNPTTRAWSVWSYGLRNPWRFSFDRATGDIAIGDVGSGSWEEINWGAAPSRAHNVNFGWDGSCEGVGCGTDPIIVHANGEFGAIVGGYVVRDRGLPTLNGRYIYGDNWINTSVWSATPRTGAGDRAEPITVRGLSSFGEDACGRLYVASLDDDAVYRLQDGAPTPCAFAGRPADTVPPGLTVTLSGVRSMLRKRRLKVAVRCSEACQVAVGTRLRRVRRLKTRHRDLAANQRRVLTLRLSKATVRKVRRRLRRSGFVRIAVTVRAVDAAGNARSVTRRGRLKRRR